MDETDPFTFTKSARLCRVSFNLAWQALLDVLQSRGEAIEVQLREDKSGRLLTEPRVVSKERLQEIVQNGDRVEREGWYKLDFEVREVSPQRTRIQLTLLIVENDPLRQNVFGGIPRRSNGTMEREIFSALVQELVT
jgi:hypothetical protein